MQLPQLTRWQRPTQPQGHSIGESFLSGLAGAAALTLVHETARRLVSDAPRMDRIGRRVIARSMEGMGIEPPHRDTLQGMALAGDLVSNTLFYSLVGAGRRMPLARGAVLGAAAGLGALVVPQLLGLGRRAQGATNATKAMTFSWYLLGGLAAAATLMCLDTWKEEH